jgi:AAA domain
MSSPPTSSHAQNQLTSAERHARILRYWRAVELFSPQRIPRLNPNSRTEPVFRSGGELPFPWEIPGWFASPEKGYKWRFTTYCGVYKLGRVRARLQRHFGRPFNSFDRRPDGESCLFALQVTEDGRPLLDTFVLSSCAWAVGRLENPGPAHTHWLNGFEACAREEALRLAERFALRENDEIGRKLRERGIHVGRPVQSGDLEAEIGRIAQSLGVLRILQPIGAHLATRQVSEKFEYQAESDDFLNSFFLRDLERVAEEAAGGNTGPALSLFLSNDESIDADTRLDVRTTRDLLWANSSPEKFPLGRWPASPGESLYFSQQFALNSALLSSGVEPRPIFGINGPPGTGKTTLLRDLIAAVVVQRAQRLASLENPRLAFSGPAGHWSTGDYQRFISLWREDLLGFEMVVASSNNRAVENVTLEIPATGAVDEQYLADFDYFADFAGRLLSDKRVTPGEAAPAWGLVAARLGSKRNRRRFISRFWGTDKEAPEPRTRAQLGFLEYLKHVKTKPRAWQNAVAAFKAALKEEAELRADRMAAWKAADARATLASKLAAAQSDLATQRLTLRQSARAIESTETLRNETRTKLNQALLARREHLTFKPGLVDALFSRGRAYAEWRARDLLLAAAVDTLEAELNIIAQHITDRHDSLRQLENEIDRLEADIAQKRNQLAEQDRLLSRWRDKLGPAFPDGELWPAQPNERELSSPWADEAWSSARTRVFLEALHLHRTFIECVPAQIRNNLHGAMDILTGKAPPADFKALQSAWATLFFVIPVISTTFASFDRLFSHLGRESLGWLLIDEAGQAVPQAAAGALWRSRRTLVVGDPRQLEPIVSLPFTAQQALRTHFGIDETWLPSRNSVQSLADRVSQLGTELTDEETGQQIWVGCPLRVHRRCEEPMFSISNQIAYSGQMVSATIPLEIPVELSSWIDISASEADDHWIPHEGAALEILLAELFRCRISPASILLISPFRAVARRLRGIATRHGITQAGTIHVSQGKEADIVILVLGGNPRSPGAKEWASEKPNLLNVAVSRARRRLFIIGNCQEWAQYPHFSDAAAILERHKKLHAERIAAAR